MSIVVETRSAELERALEDHILKVMMHLQARGWGTSEILDALESVCRHQRETYEEDADPADDLVGQVL